MKKTFAVAAVAGLVALKLFGAAPVSAGSLGAFYTFGEGVKPWVASAEDPRYVPKGTLTHRLEYGPTLIPNGYAALTNKDAYAVWMQVPIQNTGDTVDIALDARSDENCGRCALLVYAGNTAPTSPWDFQKLDAPLTKVWEHHKIRFTVKGDLVVAIGIMNLDYGTKLKQIAGTDNVRIVTQNMTLSDNGAGN